MAQFTSAERRDFRPGETLTVYVNPEEPDYAVIYPGGAGAAFVILSLLAGCAVFFGVGGVVWALSRASAQDFAIAGHAA